MKLEQDIKRKIIIWVIILIIPCILAAGIFFGFRNYGIMATVVIILSILPFFIAFENKKPSARDIMPIAVMAAVAAVGRFAFAALPQFKPIIAIIIITGAVFGSEAGFLCGATAMLTSNFFFGQGPWTPWQMFACGIIGFFAGIFFRKGIKSKWSICLYGFLMSYVYGIIVDAWSVFGFGDGVTFEAIAAVYASGFWFNTILGIATAFFLFVLAKPMAKKLERIKTKYNVGADRYE